MKRAWTTAYLTLLLLLTVPLHGQDSIQIQSTLAGLPGVMLEVIPLASAIEERGITSGVLAAEVERRLEAANIPVLRPGDEGTAPGLQTLVVEVLGIIDEYSDQCTWSVHLDLMQAVRMERNPDTPALMASTWSVRGLAYQSKDWRKGIVDDVLHYTDRFVAAFAAANAP